jgi:predicted nucleic acid-binding protein
LRYWPEKHEWGRRRRLEFDRLLSRYPVIPYRYGMDKRCAELRVRAERLGLNLSWPDRWVAATAAWHDITVVTHDAVFDRVPGIRVLKLSANEGLDPTDVWGVTHRPMSPDAHCRCGY